MSGSSPDDKRLLEEVQLLLWAGWDPIGCGAPRDEYDSYAEVVFGKVKNGATQREIIDYLHHVERDLMGLGTRPHVSEIIAEKAAVIVHGEGYDFMAETEVKTRPFRRS